jgi:hypothetical protein
MITKTRVLPIYWVIVRHSTLVGSGLESTYKTSWEILPWTKTPVYLAIVSKRKRFYNSCQSMRLFLRNKFIIPSLTFADLLFFQ